MALDKEVYKAIVEKYASADSIFKGFDKAHYNPEARAFIGQETMGDSQAYVNAGTDSFYLGARKVREVSAKKFQTETRENLEEILKDVSDSAESNGLLAYMMNVPAPEGDEYKEIAEKHKKILTYQEIAKSKDTKKMTVALVEAHPEFANEIKYLATNNSEGIQGVFTRGLLGSALNDFTKEFVKEVKEDGTPVFDEAKLDAYFRYALRSIKDPEKFADTMLPLVAQAYLKQEEN